MLPDAFKEFLNGIFNPVLYTVVSITLFVLLLKFYRVWTKPRIAGAIFGFMLVAFALSFTDPNFRKIVTKPDNIPIVSLIFIIYFFLWVALRQAAVNDERMEKGQPPMEALETNDRVLTWPDLVYSEFIASIIGTVVLVIWSVFIKAPLEEPANPGKTPNPSKAPWYFLGLQEMLVYFDPWIAGVVLPTMIITGLIAIAYCDKNPKGLGYYTLKDRPFAISTYLFGFVILWVSLIIMGTALRGPNWNFFGPYETWDVHKLESLSNVNLSEFFWVKWTHMKMPESFLVRELPGIVLIGGYFTVMPPFLLYFRRVRRLFNEIGFIRYSIMMVHVLVMGGMLIKMVCRWSFNLKYFIFIPEYFFNI